jgi:prepilin-type N-terminal cleavage/methylation domain-containing protein
MRFNLNLLKRNSGFTLIELLVVIGILGVLAAALIATIDPFEQLKKANDSNVKNAAVEFLNANVRYYTTHTAFPWDASGAGVDCLGDTTGPNGSSSLNAGVVGTSGPINCLNALVSDNELKPGFINATSTLARIYPTYNAGTKELTVCFLPESKSQQNDANTKYNANGVTSGNPKDCTSTSLTNGCFWCTK